MTFDEWWDSSKAGATPDTYRGWEQSCRAAWLAGAAEERNRIAKQWDGCTCEILCEGEIDIGAAIRAG